MEKMDEWKRQATSPDLEFWPEIRWWLAEGFHTDETIKREIQTLYEAGFGAVEFLAMEEPGADSARYGGGSEEWLHDSEIIFQEAAKLGMGE